MQHALTENQLATSENLSPRRVSERHYVYDATYFRHAEPHYRAAIG